MSLLGIGRKFLVSTGLLLSLASFVGGAAMLQAEENSGWTFDSLTQKLLELARRNPEHNEQEVAELQKQLDTIQNDMTDEQRKELDQVLQALQKMASEGMKLPPVSSSISISTGGESAE